MDKQAEVNLPPDGPVIKYFEAIKVWEAERELHSGKKPEPPKCEFHKEYPIGVTGDAYFTPGANNPRLIIETYSSYGSNDRMHLSLDDANLLRIYLNEMLEKEKGEVK